MADLQITKAGIIYRHICLINNKTYVGFTTQNPQKRFKNGKSYSGDFKFGRAIKKHGWENFRTEILESDIPQSNIAEREIFWIKHFNSYKNGYNSTLGGEGMNGFKHSEKTRKLLSEKFAGKRMEEAWSAKKEPVCMFSLDGTFLKTYDSIAEAALDNKLFKPNVWKCCQKKQRYSGGYIFTYEKDAGKIVDFVSNSYRPRSDSIPVVQIEKTSGRLVNKYSSILEAYKITKIHHINSAIEGKRKTAGGYIWRKIYE